MKNSAKEKTHKKKVLKKSYKFFFECFYQKKSKEEGKHLKITGKEAKCIDFFSGYTQYIERKGYT